MKFTVTYDYKSYSQLLVHVFYSQKRAYFVVTFGVLMLLAGCFFLIMAPWDMLFKSVFIVAGLFLISLPLIASKIAAKRSFSSNKMFQEAVVYEFMGNTIKTTGESFTSELSWSSIHKVKELKDWFLIYQSKQLFYMIPKEALGDKQSELKDIIKRQKGLKYTFLKTK